MTRSYATLGLLMVSLAASAVWGQAATDEKPVLHMRNHRPPQPETEPVVAASSVVWEAPVINSNANSSETVAEAEPPFLATTPPPTTPRLLASKMHCTVQRSQRKPNKWLLICNNVSLEDIYFEEAQDCTIIEGVRECSLLL